MTITIYIDHYNTWHLITIDMTITRKIRPFLFFLDVNGYSLAKTLKLCWRKEEYHNVIAKGTRLKIHQCEWRLSVNGKQVYLGRWAYIGSFHNEQIKISLRKVTPLPKRFSSNLEELKNRPWRELGGGGTGPPSPPPVTQLLLVSHTSQGYHLL